MILGERVPKLQPVIMLVMNGLEAMQPRHGSAARIGDTIRPGRDAAECC